MTHATRPTPWAGQEIDPELAGAVGAWSPGSGDDRPTVVLEAKPEGVRVALTYKGVESGFLFARGARASRATVHATLDRLYDVLSWRVTSPPAPRHSA